MRSLLLSVLLLAGCTSSQLAVPEGGAATEISAHSATIWSRGAGAGTMHVALADDNGFAASGATRLAAANDYTGHVRFDSLRPYTRYAYSIRLPGRGARTASLSGSFRTAPEAADAQAVAFAFGADLAGQNVCRDATAGFPIFAAIEALPLDFFVGLGDMIYADAVCEETGALGNAQVPGDFTPSDTVADFHQHWRYTLADAGLRALRARSGYYAVWDDHEVVNDFGPGNDRRTESGPALMAPGLKAFLDYNPISSADGKRLYRKFRHGAHAELFLLDTRRYRDHNALPDSADRPKSLLGRQQAQWLKTSVAASSATWKFIISSVPLSLPTGWPRDSGRDGWADDGGPTGYENELLEILRAFKADGVRNLVWLSADVHFATGFEYVPFSDEPGFKMHEFVAGPLNAGLFPTQELDLTLNPRRLYFHGPSGVGVTENFEAATGWFNLGHVRIGATGELWHAVIDGHGKVVQEISLRPVL